MRFERRTGSFIVFAHNISIDFQNIDHIRFELDLRTGMLEHFAVDQENVLDSFTQRHDLCGMQIDLVAAEYLRD